MGAKRKPKDESKKAKNSQSNNQALLFQYFPDLNQIKTKAYQKMLSKPNAVFKEEVKLHKQVLSDQNLIIKEVNKLYRQVFKEADHQQINHFAELFQPSKFIRMQNFEEEAIFSTVQIQSHSNFIASDTFKSPNKRSEGNVEEKDQSSEYTKTVTARKNEQFDLTDFQFHESEYKKIKIQQRKASKKYSEAFLQPEETNTICDQRKSLAKSQSIMNSPNSIKLKTFDFPPFKTEAEKQTPNKQVNLGSERGCCSLATLAKQTQNEAPIQFQPNQTQLRFQPLDINSQSDIKDSQDSKYMQNKIKLRKGLSKIMQLIQKKHKARQEEKNFRMYVQQARQKNFKTFSCNQSENLSFNQQFSKQQNEYNEKICIVKKSQALDPIQGTNFDVLDCILKRQHNPIFRYYFEGQDDEQSPQKQISYQFKESPIEIKGQFEENQDQVSTKQQSQNSQNTVSSSRFVRYLDSLQPSFDLPDNYLNGYVPKDFGPNFFRQIHELQLQRCYYEAQIKSKII